MFFRVVSAGWGQLVAGLLSFLALRFYSDMLGPDAFGAAMLAVGGFTLLDGIASMAFAQVLALLLRDIDERSARLGLALGLARRFSLWLALLCLFGVIAGGWWFGLRAAFWLASAAACFTATEGLRATGLTLAMLERRLMVISSWNALDAVASLVASVLAIHISGASPAAVPVGMLLGRALTTCVLVPFAIGWPGQWTADIAGAKDAMPRAIGFGWSLVIMTPLAWVGSFADRYIVNLSTGIVAAGVLSALAGAVSRPYSISSAALTNLFRPDLLDHVAGRPARHAQPLKTWIVSAIAVGLAGVIGFALLGELIAGFVIKFPSPGIDRGLLMTLLAISQVFVLISHGVDNQLLALGWGKSLLASQVAINLIGLPVIMLGAAVAGAEGAACGRIANEACKVLSVSAILWFRKRSAARVTTGFPT